MKRHTDTWTLALCIALLPPLWAVAAPYLGVTTGAVALICAGLHSAEGGRNSTPVSLSLGFLLGDFWAVVALYAMEWMTFNPDLELFVTLFVLGGLAVLLSALAPRWIFCPSWLCGWAIGLTILSPEGVAGMGSLPVQIGVAMLVGVWYVGAFLGVVQRKLSAWVSSS